jgi:uncharacterized protein (DUF1697 family)
LRAINLAGRNMVGMASLRDLLTGIGLLDVHTLLQSGNVVFRSTASETTAIARAIEEACLRELAVETDIFVRTVSEWDGAVAANPFPEEAVRDPGHLVVVVCGAVISAASVRQLQAAIAGREQVRAVGSHAYVTYPDGIGRSKLTSAMIEKALGTRGTARNWNTVLKLQQLARLIDNHEGTSPTNGPGL